MRREWNTSELSRHIIRKDKQKKLMAAKELRGIRKEMFAEMEQRLNVNRKPEDSFFYYHSSEDRIVLSHSLFRVMTRKPPIQRKVG